MTNVINGTDTEGVIAGLEIFAAYARRKEDATLRLFLDNEKAEVILQMRNGHIIVTVLSPPAPRWPAELP